MVSIKGLLIGSIFSILCIAIVIAIPSLFPNLTQLSKDLITLTLLLISIIAPIMGLVEG